MMWLEQRQEEEQAGLRNWHQMAVPGNQRPRSLPGRAISVQLFRGCANDLHADGPGQRHRDLVESPLPHSTILRE